MQSASTGSRMHQHLLQGSTCRTSSSTEVVAYSSGVTARIEVAAVVAMTSRCWSYRLATTAYHAAAAKRDISGIMLRCQGVT